jgi:hypothetical protein
MQKIVNVISIFSGIVSLTMVSVTGYVVLNKDSIIENVKNQVAAAAGEAITSALPGMMDASMPELPSATGGAIPPLPTSTGPAFPLGL